MLLRRESGIPGAAFSGTLRFKCADDQGAMLVLKHEAVRESLHPSKDLTRYIVRNHESWCRFAQDVFRLDIKPHDIIFVSGCVKTAEWALAAATHRARECELMFGGEFAPSAKAAFSFGVSQESAASMEHRSGPERTLEDSTDEDGLPKRDQCVFLHYYKFKRRRILAPKVIRAAANEESPANRSPSPEVEDGEIAEGSDEDAGSLSPTSSSIIIERTATQGTEVS